VHLFPGHGEQVSEADLGPIVGPPRVEYEKLSDDRLGESSAAIRARVEATRERQRCRFEGIALLTNADTPALAAQASVQQRPRGTRMSARAYHRTRSVKLARTMADLASGENIQAVHPACHSALGCFARRSSFGRGDSSI
jgi:magnesium chelatase family protein